MHKPNVRLSLVVVGIGVLTVATVTAALLGNVSLAMSGLSLLVAAAASLAVLLHLRTQRAIAAARRSTARRLDGLEKRLATSNRRTRDLVTRQPTELHRSLLTDQQALHQLLTRFQPEAPLPAIAGWALDPTALFWLADEVDRTRPRLIVECGSGTSTLWLALALRRNGAGRVISFEHSAEFAAATRQRLERHGLADWAEVRVAPLVPTGTSHGTLDWYDVGSPVPDAIDLLLVDGPPASTGQLARYPAIPVFGPHLSPDALVVLDDAWREDEGRVVQLWLTENEQLRPSADPGPRTRAFTWAADHPGRVRRT